jgi:hypothetical protein
MRTPRIASNPRRLLAATLLAFAAWFILLLSVMFIDHRHMGHALFSSRVATGLYLGVQGLLTLAAIGMGLLTLVFGSWLGRLIVILPMFFLVIYALMFIAGPG